MADALGPADAPARPPRPDRPARRAVADAHPGPQVRLGTLWGLLALVCVLAGPVALTVLLAPVAAVAAVQTARSWRRRPRRPSWAAAGSGAGLLAAAAVIGVRAVLAVAVLLAVASVLAWVAVRLHPSRVDPLLSGVIAISVGLAAAAPVLLRRDELVPAFVLLAYALVHDASAFVVGSGAPTPWEGTAAGVASIGAVTLGVAAVLVPPFRGASPWALGALAAVLTPLGPLAAVALIGDRRARVPALCRLDSLLVLGPIWALAATLTLD